jgi:hypothetical protein
MLEKEVSRALEELATIIARLQLVVAELQKAKKVEAKLQRKQKSPSGEEQFFSYPLRDIYHEKLQTCIAECGVGAFDPGSRRTKKPISIRADATKGTVVQ